MAAAFLNPKGYGDGAIAGLCSTEVDPLGGGRAELNDRASPHATGVSPISRLRLDRPPTRDLVPTARRRIPVEHDALP